MTKREDIGGLKPDGTISGRLIYTCRAGWIDLGHAGYLGLRKATSIPAAQRLWEQVRDESGKTSKDKRGFLVTTRQTTYNMTAFGLMGVDGTYWVKRGLSTEEKQGVALAIFLKVSKEFEAVQSSWWYPSNSGFSVEDLVSNVVGFYWSLEGADKAAQDKDIADLKPVTKAAAEKIWDKHGAVGSIKNKAPVPMLFPCSECSPSPDGPKPGSLPDRFNYITPADMSSGLFRAWNPKTDQ